METTEEDYEGGFILTKELLDKFDQMLYIPDEELKVFIDSNEAIKKEAENLRNRDLVYKYLRCMIVSEIDKRKLRRSIEAEAKKTEKGLEIHITKDVKTAQTMLEASINIVRDVLRYSDRHIIYADPVAASLLALFPGFECNRDGEEKAKVWAWLCDGLSEDKRLNKVPILRAPSDAFLFLNQYDENHPHRGIIITNGKVIVIDI